MVDKKIAQPYNSQVIQKKISMGKQGVSIHKPRPLLMEDETCVKESAQAQM